MLRPFLRTFLLCLPTASCLAQTEIAPPLRARLAKVLDAPEFAHAHWGLLVVDAKTGAVVLEEGADKLFAPASTTKLFTCAAALQEFGPEHRFVTRVVRTGEVQADGTLRGDLVLVASGDPTLGGRTLPDGTLAFTSSDHTYANGNERGRLTDPDPLAGLQELARQVAAAGIKNVNGEIRVDDRLFEPESSTGSGPRRLVPIVVNDNLVDLVITPAKAGEPAAVALRPASALVHLDADVTTAAKGARTTIAVRAAGAGRLVVRGALAEDHAPLVRTHEVEDAASHARALWIGCLRRAGVVCQASALDANPREGLPGREVVANAPVVATFTSVPLLEHVKVILKVSHNYHASLLPLLLAAKHGKRTLGEGLRVEKGALDALGVPTATISFGGGAGGAASDRTTPRATVALLAGVAKSAFAAGFRSALPVLGVDGTLASALPEGSPARGKAQAKTGTYTYDNLLNGTSLLTSKALAGWLTGASGREFLFCFVVNGVPLGKELDSDAIGRRLGELCALASAAL